MGGGGAEGCSVLSGRGEGEDPMAACRRASYVGRGGAGGSRSGNNGNLE